MTLRLTIKDETIHHREGVSKRTGKPYRIPQQHAWVTLANGETRRVTVMLPDGALPFLKGDYVLGPDSFGVNQYGDLELARIRLLPASAPAAKAA